MGFEHTLYREHVSSIPDPVHDYIHIQYRIIMDLINAPEFQRLRRIKQLGTFPILSRRRALPLQPFIGRL